MKLLGWMHRKLKHNCNEAVKNRTTAQTSFDGYADPTYGFSSLSGTGSELSEEKPLNELFHGFLAIGTLGYSSSEAALFNSTEPPTPTFPTSSEETTQITDQDLKLITKELEKFLEAEEAAAAASSEDAQSSKRSSYASIITLTDKTQQDSSSSSSSSSSAPTLLLDCPLQKYFFGSSIVGLSEADMAVKNEEASLSEDLGVVLKGNCASEDKKRGKAQFAKNFMKKMLKSLNSNSKSKTHAANGGSTHESAASTKKKFPKVLKMFKKKVHPERYIGQKGAEKDENRAIPVKGSRLCSTSDKGNIWFRQMISPEEEQLIMKTSDESGSGRGGAFMENNGHWIKTDADYLVLEL